MTMVSGFVSAPTRRYGRWQGGGQDNENVACADVGGKNVIHECFKAADQRDE